MDLSSRTRPNVLCYDLTAFKQVTGINVGSQRFCKPHLLQLYITEGNIFYSMLWRHWSYNLVRFRHKTPLIRVRKRPCLTRNTRFWLPKRTARDVPILIINTWFCRHQHGWRCPDCSSQIPSFVARKTARDVQRSCYNHLVFVPQTQLQMFLLLITRNHFSLPQPRLEISRGLVKNTQFCHHVRDWRCPDSSSQISAFAATNTAANSPEFFLNTSSDVTLTTI